MFLTTSFVRIWKIGVLVKNAWPLISVRMYICVDIKNVILSSNQMLSNHWLDNTGKFKGQVHLTGCTRIIYKIIQIKIITPRWIKMILFCVVKGHVPHAAICLLFF